MQFVCACVYVFQNFLKLSNILWSHDIFKFRLKLFFRDENFIFALNKNFFLLNLLLITLYCAVILQKINQQFIALFVCLQHVDDILIDIIFVMKIIHVLHVICVGSINIRQQSVHFQLIKFRNILCLFQWMKFVIYKII